MNKLDETFDIVVADEPLTPKKANAVNVFESTEDALIADIVNSRKDYDEIMEMGKEALSKVLAIADEGQHPRFYEAAGLIIKSLTDANRERVEVHLKLSQIRKNQTDVHNVVNKDAVGGGINIDKAIFTDTTTELLALIKGKT